MAKIKKAKHYCSNEDLYTELKVYHDTGVMSDTLGLMFMKIASKLTGHSFFLMYDSCTKGELVGSAIVRMVEQIDMFDMSRPKPNPFSYFSQIAWNSFVLECKKHYKQKNIRRKIAINHMAEMEANPHIKIDGHLYNMMKELNDDDDHYTRVRDERKAMRETESDNDPKDSKTT